MPEYNIETSGRRTRIVGVFLAIFVAVASLALVALTHEPKRADSSPAPAKAAIVPQIADAKSEAEIIFRGKSFPSLKRQVLMSFKGSVEDISVVEGQMVQQDQVLASYKLDRDALNHVYRVLYPEHLLNLRKNLSDQNINLEKHLDIYMPNRKIELQRVEKDVSDIKEMFAKGLAAKAALDHKEQQLQMSKKAVLEMEENVKQIESSVTRSKEDLKFHDARQKRDLELLEWQTQRLYSDPALPIDVAYLKAPISGQVIWMNPDFRKRAELPAGFHTMTVAPMDNMVVRCKVHELDLVKLQVGDKGTVTFDAIPEKKYQCKISRIPWVSRNPALEVPADYDIECVLDDSDLKLKDGLTCNVKVTIKQ
ncbi:MAG: HlyD family efflux transporter periplasmic adaptor subunit [Desulfomonile tiedjei]|uniref:HlyD family efflux transporter periplasmic adaptor subunit n=1 Tax=Desulfomonile tiedjei TaxID=2358 RepID=A0A9D6V5K7_9BACT|nr:HlyD family efflux transporter periplasmic adaptor subunit [Desulfomonile tiedjei]